MGLNDKIIEDILNLWIGEYWKNENISHYEVDSSELSANEQGGYTGDIVFVKASGQNEKNEKKEVDIVIKISKKNKILRNSFPLRESYRREIFFYIDVFPIFKNFLMEKKVEFELNFVPKCYKTIIEDESEAIILENLKIKGFKLHSNTEPLNQNHIKLVLLNMAQFHAVSFAFRDQMEQTFENLMKNFSSLIGLVVRDKSIQTLFKNEMVSAIEYLKEIKEDHLAEQLQEKLGDDPNVVMQKVFDEDTKQSVILHGDTWINNYMFRYEDDNNFTTPAAVAFLDWQLASLHSPVIDVSQFLYAVGSEKALVTEFDNLIEFYYSNLSSCLKELGSDPEEIFPFSSFIGHWKKYSVASLIFVVGFLKTIVSEGDGMPSTENIVSGFGDVFSNAKITNIDVYRPRLVAIVRNFCNL